MEELFCKVKEDSEMQDRSLGTNQSERSGSTFSLPGNWGGYSRQQNNNCNEKWQLAAQVNSPKSQSILAIK